MHAARVENLHKTFPGGVQALVGVSLGIEDGEHLAVVGPSGSGKSTLLRVIAGLERATSGRVEIGGASMEKVAPHRRGVAMVFQEDALFPHLTVRRNIGLGVDRRGLGREELSRRIEEACEALGIGGLLDRRPGGLSGGERRRVSLAGAVVRRARVVLLDEPLSSLDETSRSGGREQLRLLRERFGLTLVHVTHDQEEALALGTRVAVLVGGRLHQVGRPLEVWESPATTGVLRAIGGSDLTFLEVVVEARDGRVWVREEGGSPRAGEEGWRVEAPASRAGSVRGGARALLGVRADAWRVGEGGVGPGPGSAEHVEVGVKRVEFLGGSERVMGTTPGGQSITARFGKGVARQGGVSVWLYPDWNGAWLFSTDDVGERLG